MTDRLREAIEDYLKTEPGPSKSRFFRRYDMYEESSRNEYIEGLETDIRQVMSRLGFSPGTLLAIKERIGA